MNVNSKNNKTKAGDKLKIGPRNARRSNISDKKKTQQNPPRAYTEGIQDFYGRDFIVTPDVLIPRPETEQIIDATLNIAGKPYLPGVKPSKGRLKTNPIILDVGTGSGCIAITIKKELENAEVYATDVSEKAIQIAQKNAVKHNAHINIIISYLLEKVNITPDLIVANLPYVDKDWNWIDKGTLAYEPSIALYANDHGLALIKELIDQASLRKIKFLTLESDPCQHESLIEYAKLRRYKHIETRGYIICFEYKKSSND